MIFCKHISSLHGFADASPVLSGTEVSVSCNAAFGTGNLLTACPIIVKGGGYLLNNQLFGKYLTGFVSISFLPNDRTEGTDRESASLKTIHGHIILASAGTAFTARSCAFFAFARRVLRHIFHFPVDVITHHNVNNYIISPLKNFQNEKKRI